MEHIVAKLADSGFFPSHRAASGTITLRSPTLRVIILRPQSDGRVAVDLGEPSDFWSEGCLNEMDDCVMQAVCSVEPKAFLQTPSRRSYGRGGL